MTDDITFIFFKCPFLKENYKTCKEAEKYGPYIHMIKKKKATQMAYDRAQMSNLTDNVFKSTIKKMFKELKENISK